jgi:CheY-like chemotaxis protein
MADLIASTSGPKVKLHLDLEPGLPPVIADKNQLELALLNLSVNARDAMPDGGRISIAAGVDSALAHAAEGHRSGLPAGRYVRLAVSDTGCGMDAETLARAIEPFFSTKGIGKGTGLGLSMVHGVANQLGGALHIDSKPGLGTTVEIWLPISRKAPSRAGPAHAAEAPAARTVLLIDDDQLARASTAEMLSDLGYAVAEAESGEDALRLLERGIAFDVIVTDHLMPGLNGTDLARQVRARTPCQPILIISGYAEVEGIAPDFARLVKPFRQAELSAALVAIRRAAAESTTNPDVTPA